MPEAKYVTQHTITWFKGLEYDDLDGFDPYCDSEGQPEAGGGTVYAIPAHLRRERNHQAETPIENCLGDIAIRS